MRVSFPPPILCFLVVLSISIPAFTQTEPSASKDSTAMAILDQMNAVAGWSSFNVPADILAIGTASSFQGDAEGSAIRFTLKVKGNQLARFEVRDGSEIKTTIVNGNQAAILTSAKAEFVSPHAAASMKPLVFPFLTDLVAAQEDGVDVLYRGTQSVRGESVHKIEIARQAGTGELPKRERGRASRLIVWVSANSWLPAQIGYDHTAINNPSAALSLIRRLSDYRAVDGVAIPYRQEIWRSNQRLYSLQLTDVYFNTGLTQADFSLPARQD